MRPNIGFMADYACDLCDISHVGHSFAKYILTYIDKFTLFVRARFLINKTADEVGKHLALLISETAAYSVTLTSDNGTEFKNKLLKQFENSVGLAHFYVAPLNPQSNRVERFHREMKKIVKTLEPSKEDICYKITMSINQYNQTTTEVLGNRSPFEVMYGRPPQLELSYLHVQDYKMDLDAYTIDENPEYKQWMTYHHKLIQNVAKNNFNRYQTLIKDSSDIDQLEIGSICLAFFPQRVGSNKYSTRYEGPFIVMKNHLNCYEVKHLITNNIVKRNRRLLKPLKAKPELLEALKNANFSIDNNNQITIPEGKSIDKDNPLEIEQDSDHEEILTRPYNLRKRK
jgi:hypothetical protein